MAAPLVVVGRVDRELGRQREQAAEEAVVQLLGVAGRQIGAPGGADEQRVAGQHAVGQHETDRVVGVPGGVQHPQAQLADDDALAVVDAQVDERRRALAVHDHRHAELPRQALAAGEVIGVGVGVEHVVDAQPLARRQRQVAFDLAALRVDHDAGAGVGAADQVRLAAVALAAARRASLLSLIAYRVSHIAHRLSRRSGRDGAGDKRQAIGDRATGDQPFSR